MILLVIDELPIPNREGREDREERNKVEADPQGETR
jgi:hypothetical protein